MKVTKEDVKIHFGDCTDIDANSFRTKCPVHNGKSQSLYITVNDNKWVNGYCHNNKCDQEEIKRYIKDLGYNKKGPGSSNKVSGPVKLAPVPTKYTEHWQHMMSDLDKKGFVLGKTLWVYMDIKSMRPIAAHTRVNKKDGDKDFYPKMLQLDKNKVKVITKGPDEPKPLYVANKTNNKDEIDLLHVYEGEKTCDAGSKIFNDKKNILHITWGFGSSSFNKADWKSLNYFKFKEIVLFPDNDEAGTKAMASIAQKLSEHGHKAITIVDFKTFPEKWDVADVKNDDELAKVMDLYEAAKTFTPEIPKEYAYINDADVFYNLQRGLMYSSTHFGRLIKGTPYTPPGSDEPLTSTGEFLQSPAALKIDQLVFDPVKPKLFNDHTATCLNSYIPYYLRPVEGDVTALTDLLDIWMPNNTDGGEGEYYRWWLTCWWSHNIQYPGKKILSAPVIVSPEGYGKGSIFRLFQKLLGTEYVNEVTQRQLESPFNPWAFRKLMLFFDELKVEAGSRVNIMNMLKFLITEPMVSYNDKYKLERDIINTFNICCYSNHRNAITIKEDARRWFCHFIENKPDQRIFDNLIQLMERKPGAVLKYFKEFDLSEWKSWKEPPKTRFFYEICEVTENLTKKWLNSRWKSDMFPFHPECSLVVIEDLDDACQKVPSNPRINALGITSWLQDIKAKPLGQMRIHGQKKSFWDLKPDRVRAASPADLVREYMFPVAVYDGGKTNYTHLNHHQQGNNMTIGQLEGCLSTPDNIEPPF